MLKIQKYLYYLLFFVTPFIMLSSTSELFEFNKLIFIYIISSLLLCVWMARMFAAKKVLFKRTPFDFFIGLFFLSQLVSTFFSIDIHTSIFGYYGRFNGGLLSVTAFLIVYYSLSEFMSATVDRKAIISMLMKISLLASTLVILWGLPGKFGHDLSCLIFSGKLTNSCWTAQFDPAARMFSTLGQPNWLGAYLDITFFIALYYFLRAPLKLRQPRFYAISAVSILQLLGIYFTNSRSSVAAVIAGALAFFVWVMIRRRYLHLPHLKEKTIAVAALFIVTVLIYKTGVASIDKYISLSTYFKPSITTQTAKRAQPQSPAQAPAAPLNITDSLVIRKIVWQGAEKLGMEYPLFGTGVETFAYSYYFVRPVAHNLTSEWDFLYNKAHNEYLNYFATTGFFGLGTYLLFLGAVIIMALLWIRPGKLDEHADLSLLQALLFASWITILITDFVGFSTTVISMYFYIIPVLLFYLEVLKRPAVQPVHAEKKAYKLSGSSALIGYGIPLLLAVFFVQYFVSYWLADTKYALADNLSKANDYQNAAALLGQAMQLRPDHVYEDKLSYYLANLAFIAAYQKNNQLATQLMQDSAKYNESSLLQSPQNILYWKTKVKDLYIFYQITLDKKYIEDGVKALKESEKLSPTDAKLPYFMATYDSLLYDDEKDSQTKAKLQTASLEEVNKSIALKSDYYESYYLKAQLYRKYKMIPQAKETYEYILKNISPGNTQIEQELKSI